MSFQVPEHLRPLRALVERFIEERLYPLEQVLQRGDDDARVAMVELQQVAKEQGLWALGHPEEVGGGGLPLTEYLYVKEVEGRSEFGHVALGSLTLQDVLMLQRHAQPRCREWLLQPLVRGEISPSFAMTEPGVASSDPTQLQTRAVLDGDKWVINGRKWFTTGASHATYTTVMCRTEDDVAKHHAFSLIVVPTRSRGCRIIRELPVLGLRAGQCEVEYDDVRVPADNLLGSRGKGFFIAQERLGIVRFSQCARWIGQAQRAFDLMCHRLNGRVAFGEVLAEKQLMQQKVFDSYTEIQSCRLLTHGAAQQLARGDDARVSIGAIKVVGASMLQNVIDRSLQVFGAEGLTDDIPLSFMYRTARFARIYDGPDEVHVQSVAKTILKEYRQGCGWDFSLR